MLSNGFRYVSHWDLFRDRQKPSAFLLSQNWTRIHLNTYCMWSLTSKSHRVVDLLSCGYGSCWFFLEVVLPALLCGVVTTVGYCVAVGSSEFVHKQESQVSVLQSVRAQADSSAPRLPQGVWSPCHRRSRGAGTACTGAGSCLRHASGAGIRCQAGDTLPSQAPASWTGEVRK